MAVLGPFLPKHGLNAKSNALMLPQDQATTFSDYYVDFNSVNARRGLSVRQTALLGAVGFRWVNGLMPYYDRANDVHALVASCNSKLYTAPCPTTDTGTFTYTDRTGAQLIGNSPGQQRTCGTLNNIFVTVAYADSGSNRPPVKLTAYNTNAATLGGTPPNADICHMVNNFMFLGIGFTGTNNSRVYWSNVGDPETWGASNFVDFRKNDGDAITALHHVGTDLIIFKSQSIGRLNTNPPSSLASVSLGPLTEITANLGCAGPLAVDAMPDGSLVFLGSDCHLYRFDGVSFFDFSDRPGASTPSTTYGGFINTAAQNANNDGSVVFVYPNRKHIYVSGSTALPTNNTLWVYDYGHDAWMTYTGLNTGAMAKLPPNRTLFAGTTGWTNLAFAGNYSGQVVQIDDVSVSTPTDDTGAAVTADLVFSINFSGEATDFIPRSAIILQNKAAMTVTFGFDGTMNSASSYSATPGNARQVIPISVKNLSTYVKPQSLQIRIQSSAALSIYGVYVSDEVAN